MARSRVERAPRFDSSNIDIGSLLNYSDNYSITDTKGRYLHWEQIKRRVPRNEAQAVWHVIKFHRQAQQKHTGLIDEQGEPFTYLIPHSLEAKLHQIVRDIGGSVGVVGEKSASDHIQRKFLVSSLVMEEAITSAQLEGAATTREDAKKMLQEQREPQDEHEQMILNNYYLLKHAEENAHQELSVELILELHEVATDSTTENNVVPGQLRESDDIFVEDDRGEIAHQPPSFKLLPERLQKLCDFANQDHSGLNGETFIPPIVKAIILHFMIGYEHPFRDGNGRTARAIFYWFMLKNDYQLFKYISISKLLRKDPKGYGLSYLYTEKDQNDLTYFIDFQVKIIVRAFAELENYLRVKTDEFQRILQILENTDFSEQLNYVQKDIIKKGAKEPGRIFTVKEVVSDYEIAANTARTYLNKLVELKVLLLTYDGKTKMYLAPNDLKVRLKLSDDIHSP